MDQPRNFLVEGVERNWAKLARPVSPFGTEQYELQIATTDKAKAEEMRNNHLNVKEKDGKFVVALKRKAKKADGTENGAPRVVNGDKSPMEDPGSIGNGSIGNVIVFQYPYEAMGRKGIANSLTAVQVTKLEKYEATGGVDFDVVGESSTESAADLF